MNTFSMAVKSANSRTPLEVLALLRRHVRGIVKVERCKTLAEDIEGTDYVGYFRDGSTISIDLKELSYIPASPFEDRVLLETDIYGRLRKDGWAVDESKATDLFLIVRGDNSSVHFWARALRRALKRKRAFWIKRRIARVGINYTRGNFEVFSCGYITVPRAILERECAKVAA